MLSDDHGRFADSGGRDHFVGGVCGWLAGRSLGLRFW